MEDRRETNFLRGVEFDYGQQLVTWYQTSRILTLNGTTILYLPRDFTLSLGATGLCAARFSGTGGGEWRPSGNYAVRISIGKIGARKRLSGKRILRRRHGRFSRKVDQIGRFASQTYGGGLRFQISARQGTLRAMPRIKKTHPGTETDTSFGLSYGIHF